MEAGLPMAWVPPGVEVNTPDHWVLAKDEVKHVGDPVALVIGDDRYARRRRGRGRHRRVRPAAGGHRPRGGARGRLAARARAVRDQQGLRVVARRRRPRGRLRRGRRTSSSGASSTTASPAAAIEPRAVLADYRADRLTVYSSTQVPHFLRLFLAIILGISEDRVRAVAPEVGGAFGSKLQIYAEEIGCAWASRKLGRPVKWVETRSEGMMVTHHGRDQIDKVKVGFKRRRHDDRVPRDDHRRPRRLPDAAHADDPAAERVRHVRRLQDPGGPHRRHRRDDEQVPHGRDPRGGAARRRPTSSR